MSISSDFDIRYTKNHEERLSKRGAAQLNWDYLGNRLAIRNRIPASFLRERCVGHSYLAILARRAFRWVRAVTVKILPGWGRYGSVAVIVAQLPAATVTSHSSVAYDVEFSSPS